MAKTSSESLLKSIDWKKGSEANLLEGTTLILDNGNQLELKETIHQAYGLRGYGTLVLKAKLLDSSMAERSWPEQVVVKLSCRPKSRTPEWRILGMINDAIHRTNTKWVQHHLPEILYHEAVESAVDIPGRLAPHSSEPDTCEERTLGVQVFAALHPTTELGTDEILKCVLDAIKCHKWVYETAHVLHRDISLRNLMYRIGEKGEVYGVLNDFDLATPTSELDRGLATERTGTHPFMAIDLLCNEAVFGLPAPPPHLYQHDLESFFYLLCHILYKPTMTQIPKWSAADNFALVQSKTAIAYMHPERLLLLDHQGMAGFMRELACLFFQISVKSVVREKEISATFHRIINKLDTRVRSINSTPAYQRLLNWAGWDVG